MKLFQELKKNLAVFGIFPLCVGDKCRFNPRNMAILLFFATSFSSAVTSFLFESENLQEYTKSFYVAITTLFTSAGLFVIILKSVELFQLIEHIERIVAKGK